MKEIRFYADNQADGSWSVIDVTTGKPATLNGQMCCLLKKSDVAAIIDYLQKQMAAPSREIAARG